jgi:hypothetical protein
MAIYAAPLLLPHGAPPSRLQKLITNFNFFPRFAQAKPLVRANISVNRRNLLPPKKSALSSKKNTTRKGGVFSSKLAQLASFRSVP